MPEPRKRTKAEILSHLSLRTGLDRNTIKDLMKKGWVYTEQEREDIRFSRPTLWGSDG